ncbi:MAG: TolC family protein [bacterium]|nr:TolC family protein [bacterium]
MPRLIIALVLVGSLCACLCGAVAGAEDKPVSVADWDPNAKRYEPKTEEAAAKATDTAKAEPAASAAEKPAAEAPKEAPKAPEPIEPKEPIRMTEEEAGLKAKLQLDNITLDDLYHQLEGMPDRQELKMTLYDCVALALVANQDILVTEFEPLKADGESLASRGEFDPTYSISGSFTHSETTPSSQTNAFLGGGLGGSGGGLTSLLGGGGSSSSGLLGGLLGGGGGGSMLGGFDDQLAQSFPLLAGLLQIGGTVVQNRISIYERLTADDSGTVIEFETERYETSVAGKLPWGTQYELKLNIEEEASTYNQFVPEWSGGTSLSLTQPLLRGRGKNANMARIRQAVNSRRSGEHQLEQQVMTTMADVVKAYWDLVGAVDQVRVREESLQNAERLLQINERRLEIGTGAAIEVLQAKAALAGRVSDLVSARSQVQDSEDRLKQLLDLREDDLIVPVQIVPVDRPKVGEIPMLDEKASVTTALDKRPEVRIAMIDIDNADIERKRSANDLLPQVDVSGSYFRGGRGGVTQDVFRGIEHEDDMNYSFSANASVPITNRAARGAHLKASQTKRQAEQRLDKTKLDLASNVRMALRGVNTSKTLIESNRQTVALQETNVQAERKRLQLGVTTTYDVLKIQEDLTTAQSQEVQSIVNFQKAIIDLQLAEGVLLEKLGVEYEVPGQAEAVGFFRSIVPVAPK